MGLWCSVWRKIFHKVHSQSSDYLAGARMKCWGEKTFLRTEVRYMEPGRDSDAGAGGVVLLWDGRYHPYPAPIEEVGRWQALGGRVVGFPLTKLSPLRMHAWTSSSEASAEVSLSLTHSLPHTAVAWNKLPFFPLPKNTT